jgi:hypothetical protein
MAIVTVPQFDFPGSLATPQSAGSQVISASGHVCAFLCQATVSGTIDSIKFRTGIVATGDIVRVSFQAVDMTTGNPTGTVQQFRDVTILSTDDNISVTTGLITSDGTNGGTKRTVTQGDFFFVCFSFPSYVSGNMQLSNFNGSVSSNVYMAFFNGTTWTKTANTAGNLVLSYSTLGLIPSYAGPVHFNAIGNTNFSTTSTPDERGVKFRLPVGLRVVGVAVRLEYLNPGEIVLYDSNGTSVMASIAFDPDVRALTAIRTQIYYFNATVELLADTDYRLVVKPTTSSNVNLGHVTFFNAADRAGTQFGTNWCLTSRTDGGSWSDDTTQIPGLWLICNGIDAGSSGVSIGRLISGGV